MQQFRRQRRPWVGVGEPTTTTIPRDEAALITPTDAAEAAEVITQVGFGCEDYADVTPNPKVTVADTGECTVAGEKGDEATERARIDLFADQAQMDLVVQSVRDMGFGVTTMVGCELWTVTLDTEETATAMADALGCATLS